MNKNINENIDCAIFESEKEMDHGGKSIDIDEAMKQLDEKYYEK